MEAANIIAKIRWEDLFADVLRAKHCIQTRKAVSLSMVAAVIMVDVSTIVLMVSRVTTTALVEKVTDSALMEDPVKRSTPARKTMADVNRFAATTDRNRFASVIKDIELLLTAGRVSILTNALAIWVTVLNNVLTLKDPMSACVHPDFNLEPMANLATESM